MVLVLGIGNVLRCDDGAGIRLVERLSSATFPHVHTKISQQLQVEFLEEVVQYDQVILVDASVNARDVILQKIHPPKKFSGKMSHHISPEFFSYLAKTVYNTALDLYVCSIPGECFELGEVISSLAERKIQEALKLIKNFLKKGSVPCTKGNSRSK